MITKTVTSGQRSATATISEETKFVFSGAWDYFHVQNLGPGIARISMSQGAAADDDGVIAIPEGGAACTSHGFPANTVYVTAIDTTDVVQIIGSSSAISPFKSAAGGGGTAETYTTLYDGSLSSTSTATLADDVSNYKKIEILFDRGGERYIDVFPAAVIAVNKVYLGYVEFTAQDKVESVYANLTLLRIRGIN